METAAGTGLKKMNNSSRRLATASLMSFAIKIVGALVSYGMVVVFARMLSHEEYGRFALGLNAAIVLAALSSFGFATGIMRYWPQYIASGDIPRARGVMELGYGLTSMSGFVLLALVVAGGALVQHWPRMESPGFFAIVGALALIVTWGDYSTNLLRAQGSTVASMLPRDVLWRVLTPAIAFAVLAAGYVMNGNDALIISAGVLLILTIGQAALAFRHLKALGGAGTTIRDFGAIKSSLIPLWVSSVIYAMIQQFDVVIVGSLLGKTDAGSYFAAQKTAQLLSLVLIAGGLATAPHMAALYHAGRLDELQDLCRKLAIGIAAVTACGFVVLVFGGKILLGVFDAHYVAAYPILIVLALGTVVDAISGPNAYLMQMTRFEKAYVQVMVVCYAIVVVCQFILIPRYGSLGAAIASAGGVILWNCLAIFILRRKAGLDPSLLSLILSPRPRT